MTLWGKVEFASGNQKPIFANTSNAHSNSSINGTRANTAKHYGNMIGVSAAEAANGSSDRVTHSGWVSQKIGTGGIASVNITFGGAGYNANGYLIVTNNTAMAGATGGANANISFTVTSNANSTANVITTVTINNPGDGFAYAPTLTANLGNTQIATFSVTLGGRAGRKTYETIVAGGDISSDDSAKDDRYFIGS